MKIKKRSVVLWICLALLSSVTVYFLTLHLHYFNVLSSKHSSSSDGKNVISVISVRGNPGIDYQIIRYIVFGFTNYPPLLNRTNQIILPDSGGVKVVWVSSKEVHIFTEECCEFIVTGDKQALCWHRRRLPSFEKDIDVILHSRVEYDDGPRSLIGADVEEL